MDGIATDNQAFARPGEAETVEHAAPARPLVWILTGSRVGDNNQMRALAEALGLPFEAKYLTFNALRHVRLFRGQHLRYVTRRALSTLRSPWPDVVIGLGYESVPVARYIRGRSGGRARLVQIGNPRTALNDLDLVITTPQYDGVRGPNVLALSFPIGNPARTIAATSEEEHWIKAFSKPRRLVAAGGSTRQWKIDDSELGRAINYLKQRSANEGGSVIGVTSRRTNTATRSVLESRLRGEREALVDDFPRFAVLLARCDEFYVTADSVSMLSEAILTGKKVGMIPIARSWRGRIGHWLRSHGWNLRSHADLAKFWLHLESNNLVGTVASPVASDAKDTVEIAVKAVRDLVERPADPTVQGQFT